MTQHQALAIKILALAYCCRNRGWFHTASVTRGPKPTDSTFDCQRLSGHRPRRKSGYVSLANRERENVYSVKYECGGEAHSCWMVGVRCPHCNQRQLPPTRLGHIPWSRSLSDYDKRPSGSQNPTAPYPCVRRMEVELPSQSSPGPPVANTGPWRDDTHRVTVSGKLWPLSAHPCVSVMLW